MVKTYRELLELLNNIPEDHMDDDITLCCSDEYYPFRVNLETTEETDILDEGHPFLTTDHHIEFFAYEQ